MAKSLDTTDVQLIKEKANSRCGHLRSISTGSICKSTNRKVLLSIPSRYLGTTISSCHDVCKHGKKLPFEGKVKFLASKRIPCIPHRSIDLQKTVHLEMGDKKSVIDVSVIPIDGDKSCRSNKRNITFQHSKGMEVSPSIARDCMTKTVTDERTDCFQYFKERAVSSDLANDHEVEAVTVNSSSIPAPRSPSNEKDFETRATVPVTRSRSSHSKVGLSAARIKSTRISTVDKGKVQLPITASVSLRTPRPKATRISAADRGNVSMTTSTATSLIRSVNGVSSGAKRNLKHAKSAPNDMKCGLGKEKQEHPNPDSRTENAENKIMGDIKDGVCGSNSSHSSELKGQEGPRGRITLPLTPLSRHKNLKSSQGATIVTKSPPSLGSGKRKIIGGGRSSSNSSSAVPSSRPSTTSSTGGPNETSERGTTKKDHPVTGSRSRMIPKSRPRRAGILDFEDRTWSSHKLQFRRGMVVDLKPETVVAPRRLIFRRTRIIGDTRHGTSTSPPGSGKRKISNGGRSSSNPSSAASSSRPSTTSSSGGTNETSERGTTKKHNPVTGSRSRMTPKSRPRWAGILNFEDRPRSCHKLQFRRGKVVDLKPETVIAPRRLKFRRMRIIGDTQHGTSNTAGKGLKKTETGALEVNYMTEKVVLRHRNLNGAKNVRSLFNNVIEETATKLVESRKSKVKALVGAFETVISLQDSKPRATITAC